MKRYLFCRNVALEHMAGEGGVGGPRGLGPSDEPKQSVKKIDVHVHTTDN